MNEMSTGKLLTGESFIMHDRHDGTGEPSNLISCSNETFCSLESVMALRNAYMVLRDRYNKLKLENVRLTKHMQKCCDKSSMNKSLDSHHSPSRVPTLALEVQPLSVACELEQLRGRLTDMTNMSKETPRGIDANLNNLMTDIIPKLKELELQFSGFSDAVSTNKNEMKDSSIDNGKYFPLDVKLGDEKTCTEYNLMASDDCDNHFTFNTMAIINELREVLTSVETQSTDLGHTYTLLKGQSEKLLQMKLKSIRRPSSPEPDIVRDSPEISGWSMLSDPSHIKK